MSAQKYSTFQDAYLGTLKDLHETGTSHPGSSDPLSIGSGFGKGPRAYCENLMTAFELQNPRARLLNIPARKMNIVFAVAQSVWFFSGSNLVVPISFYNSRAKNFSSDGQTLDGAYGRKLFYPNNESPIQRVVERLRTDSSTRRAVIPIFDQHALFAESRDVPCTLSLGFHIRNNALHMFCHMRSQSAVMVMPYDVFSATMIQELLACELGVELGSYFHSCESFQYYEDEETILNAVLSTEAGVASTMPSMPANTKITDTGALVAFESEMRTAALAGQLDLDRTLQNAKSLGTYWAQIALILMSHATQGAERQRVIAEIDPVYKNIL